MGSLVSFGNEMRTDGRLAGRLDIRGDAITLPPPQLCRAEYNKRRHTVNETSPTLPRTPPPPPPRTFSVITMYETE